ncbi:DUF4157 domain-containing protein (plasmid) [Phormidium sp. CLA17]|nr:DUF4157 domain-containing protein [Leptolyngbya sp. Cla-17]
MRMPEPTIQRRMDPEEEEDMVQRKVADQITPLVQREALPEMEEEEEEVIQTKTIGNQTAPFPPRESSEVPSIVHEVLNSPGQPLDPATRAFMEPRFGHDLSRVRVHTDAKAAESAQAVNARAYTVGRDVVFGNGEYAPQSAEGGWLFAHELTHVMQQNMVGSEASVRRSESAPVLQRNPARATPRALRVVGKGFEKRVDVVVTQAQNSRMAITTALDDGIKGLDATRADLEAVAKVYMLAYTHFEMILKRGEAEAKVNAAIQNLVLSIAISVAVGVPLSAALSGMVVVRILDKTLIEFGKTMVKEGVKKTLMPDSGGGLAATAEAATEDFKGKVNPTLKRLEVFQQLTDLYRELAMLGLKIDDVAQVSDWCVEAKADAREFELTGRHRTLSEIQLDMQISILEGAAESQNKLGDQIASISGRIREAQKAASDAAAKADADRMERHLWIQWMGSLPLDDADLIDADPIENRLNRLGIQGYRPHGGGGSLIDWYTGDWTSGSDVEEGVKRAQLYSAAIAAVGQIGVLYAYSPTHGKLALSRQVGDQRTPWARADGMTIQIYGEAVDGDAIRVVGLSGGFGSPKLIGQPRKDEMRGVPPPDLSYNRL